MEVSRTPTQFIPSRLAKDNVIILNQEVTVTPSSGYSSTLKTGSTWKYIGQIPEGAVYKILGDVFMISGRNNHEAYCVISNNKLVGFYLMAEQSFSPLSNPVPLSISSTKEGNNHAYQ